MSFFEKQLSPANSSSVSTTPFFSPIVQRAEADEKEPKSDVEESCIKSFGDVKDLTWAAAKFYLETEMPSSLFTPVPVNFDCTDDKGLRGCFITLKNGEIMTVYFTAKWIHVQKPHKPGESSRGFCRYSYSCDEKGQISFKEINCLRP